MGETQAEVLLIHAPYGRDAALICQVSRGAGVTGRVCTTVEELCAGIDHTTGAALIGDEALTATNVAMLSEVLRGQPPWSDLPLIVTTSGGEATAASRMRLRMLDPLGNVSLLERPLRVVTLVSAVKMALRARRRQFQLRDNFAERERLVGELERSNEELANFAHIVSHDLQAPIRTVRSFSELLVRRYGETLDGDAGRVIRTIRDGACTMEELVRTLLDYASLGQEPLTASPVDLQGVVEEVLTALQVDIEESGAVVTCCPMPIVSGDRLQLLQLIQNLVGNALKYGRSDINTAISICAEAGAGEWRVSIRDNGRGIAAEDHERIFQPLKRLHGREIAGTGMGLAVCRKIVERHHGRLWVESTPGKGARFTFTLPKQADSLLA